MREQRDHIDGHDSLHWLGGLNRIQANIRETGDNTMYRDTEFPRYRYRHYDDTFWYRDTTNIAVLSTIFSLSRPAEKLCCLLREYFSFAFD